MTNDLRWMLVRADEDGSPIRWLTDTELRELLADPSGRGVVSFHHIDELAISRGYLDPSYWKDGEAVLLRIEVVVPEQAGWRLPEDAPRGAFEPSRLQMRYMDAERRMAPIGCESGVQYVGGQGPIHLDAVHDSTRQVG